MGDDESTALSILENQQSLINPIVEERKGNIIKKTGDGFLIDFPSTVEAVECATQMQESIKIMRRDEVQGTIAHVLSMAAHSGMPFLTAYSSSKGALVTMIKNVANAVLTNQIRVNGLNIGWTDTPGEDVIQRKFHDGGEDWLEKAEKKAAFKRLTKPLDVARGLAFLCSEESGLMTGSIVDFDQSVLGWHSYSVYDYDELSDSLIGD